MSDAVESLLDVVAEASMYIEVNTAGLDKPVGEMYPAPDILRAAAERGIGVMTGVSIILLAGSNVIKVFTTKTPILELMAPKDDPDAEFAVE